MNQEICEWIAYFSAYVRTFVIVGILFGGWRVIIENKVRCQTRIFFGILLGWLLVGDAAEIYFVVRYGVATGLVVLYSVGVCQCEWEKPAFLLLFSFNLHVSAFLISDCLYQGVYTKLVENLDVNSKQYVEQLYLLVGVGQIALMIFYSILAYVFSLIFKQIGKNFERMEWQDFVFLSVLNIVGILFSYTMIGISVIKLETDIFLLFEEKKDVIWKIPATLLLLLAGEYAGIYVWKKYRMLLNERQLVFAQEEQLRQLKARFEETNVFYQDIRGVRHDMKNHMMNMKGLMEQGHYVEAAEYMKKLDQSLDSFDFKFLTGNAVCDVVINSKYRQAQYQGIDLRVQFVYQKESGVADYDMAIVLSNLLDNAMEACMLVENRHRYIELELKQRGNFFLIKVQNPFSGKLNFDEKNGMPVSSKEKGGELHGIGLQNVSAIAKRYYGTVNIETQNQIFAVTVMLQQSVGTQKCPVGAKA